MAGWAECSKVPESLQKQPCHLHEETYVQLLRAASYDVWYYYPWTLAKHAHNKLALHRLKMERRMLNTTYTPVQVYTYRRTSIWAKDRTQLTYIIRSAM